MCRNILTSDTRFIPTMKTETFGKAHKKKKKHEEETLIGTEAQDLEVLQTEEFRYREQEER